MEWLDESVWVAISFVIFIALVGRRAASMVAGMLDKRSDEIRTTLDEAKKLRTEAQDELKKYQKLSREANREAERITADALSAAETIRKNAEKAAELAIERKQTQATAKIKAMETEAVAELRARAAELAVAAAGDLITAKLDKKKGSELVKKDIDSIRKAG